MKISSGLTALLVLAAAASGGMAIAQDSSSGSKAGQDAAVPVAAPQVVGQQAAGGGTQPGDSHVRIVRLSEVQGKVGLDRKTGQGLEATMRNMPIVEGGRLATGEGVAEVEFEDDSTLRLAPNSMVEFPLLVLRGSGAKASTVKLVKGTIYVNLAGTKGNEFKVLVGQESVTLVPSTHLRLEIEGAKTTLAVMAGVAEVETASGTTVVAKKQTLTLDPTQPEQVNLAKKVSEGPYDAWDKEQNGYHQRYSRGNAFTGSQYSYGISDLNYYGSFVNVAGCGSMWQPYMVSAAWNPYANGVWAWYPGAGYSWVSPYPWGWMPFHSGSWAFCPGTGWGWQPGSQWVGLNNVAANQTVGPLKLRPPLPPEVGRSTLVVSSHAPLAVSKVSGAGNFEFRNNSAGLGVPRGSMGDLGKISHGVEQHGFVNRPVYSAPVGAGGSGPAMSAGPVTLRPGTPGGVSRDVNSASQPSASQPSMSNIHSSGGGSSGGGPQSSMGGGAAGSPGGGGAPHSGGGTRSK